MEPRLQLHHHLADRKFVLIKEGDDWRQEFNTLEEAMAAAARLIDGSVPVLVLGEHGDVVSESSAHTATFRLIDDSAQQ
ncbi:MAG TPA: hypothetical protein VK961_14590 [Chthoniobacter sp.]|nr:hypothetical protein [Chthoniobacter sp.]